MIHLNRTGPHDGRPARGIGAATFALALLAVGCGGGSTRPEPEPEPIAIPAAGGPGALDVGAWNVEWFGSASQGPGDEPLQRSRVSTAIASLDVDVWGLVEIVDAGAWSTLLSGLPDYDGVLASDPRVTGGSASYHPSEQKPALLYRTDMATLRSARVVLADRDHAFAGRPPMEAELRVVEGADTLDLLVLVVHMKAGSTADDRDRRADAAAALKSYLDTEHGDRTVLVIGDFNDDVDVSIHAGAPTPYSGFVADSAHWRFLTAALTAAGATSTTGYGDVVDHHLGSDEAAGRYVAGSARVLLLDQLIPAYESTTSDHYPVITALRLTGPVDSVSQ
jgi:endonuclease/exonuclease/phosphatase family metal-dependent hydrolase